MRKVVIGTLNRDFTLARELYRVTQQIKKNLARTVYIRVDKFWAFLSNFKSKVEVLLKTRKFDQVEALCEKISEVKALEVKFKLSRVNLSKI